MSKKILLAEMTWKEVEEAVKEGKIILLPVGSIEQHGLHLPLNTDVVNAFEIAKRVAEQTNSIVAPPILFGLCPYWMIYPGTITLKPETFINVVSDVCLSLIHHGFKKIVLINGHGGNRPALDIAIRKVFDECGGKALLTAFSYWDLARKELSELRESPLGGIAHSCELETSLQLVFQPELVEMSKAVKSIVKPISIHLEADLLDERKAAMVVKEEKGLGVFGDPTVASKGKGEKFIEVIVRKIVEYVRDIEEIRV